MNPHLLIQRPKWPLGLILLWLTLAAGWGLEDPNGVDPQRKMEIWAHGIYDRPGKAAEMITPQFLRNLTVRDRYFVDVLRMYVGTDMLRTMSIDPTQLPPVGRIITDEIKRRGDEIIPAFIALMQEPPNPYCPLVNQITIYLPSMASLDMQPILDYFRDYLREHPNEVATRENFGDYQGRTAFISKFGSEEDLSLIKTREAASQQVTWMQERLAKEKLTGVTRLEERRKAREASGLQAPATTTKKKVSGQDAAAVPASNKWLWALLLPVVIAIGMAIWRGLIGKSS
jgi:hypothetical protein